MSEISVIVPVYNARATIERALLSIQEQTVPPKEVFLIDDGSTDGSAEWLDSYAFGKADWNVIHLPKNSGRPAAPRNVGLQASQSRFVAFLDSDDEWLPTKLQRQLQHMQAESCDISATGVFIINSSGSVRGVYEPPKKSSFNSMLRLNSMLLSSVMVDADRLRQKTIGPLRFPDQGHEDYALWLNLLRQGATVRNMQTPHTVYYKQDQSASSSRIRNLKYLYGAYRRGADMSPHSAFACTAGYAASSNLRPLRRLTPQEARFLSEKAV